MPDDLNWLMCFDQCEFYLGNKVDTSTSCSPGMLFLSTAETTEPISCNNKLNTRFIEWNIKFRKIYFV